MTANTSPLFTLTPHIGLVRITTANTNRDGTGTTGSVITGATNGTRVDRVNMTATGTTTAGMVRLFITDGSSIRAWREIPVSAVTPGGTTQAWFNLMITPDMQVPLLVLPSGWSLLAATNNAEQFDVVALGGDF